MEGELLPKCIACKASPADDEYHWFDKAGIEHIWQLCGDCCEFACEVSEVVANIESEVEVWIQSGLES